MAQMKRYGIPASVILAQGIIESGSGGSELSRKGNNHFGIKATSSWLKAGGRYLVYTDDAPDEKFCAYDSVADSYEHHSRFLKENARYASLFNLRPDDHRGWAEGLQAAGYATGSKYAQTIEAVIRQNGLEKYDQQVMQQMNGHVAGQDTVSGRTITETSVKGETLHYSFPLQSKEFLLVTSPFGNRKDPMSPDKQQFHKGIDLRANHVPVLATEDGGKVIAVGTDAKSAGGKSVTVEYDREDGSKVRLFYCHLDSMDVKVGDFVNAGQQLGVSGNTGKRTTGPHLHLGAKQIASDGSVRDIDPVSYLAEIAVKGGITNQVMYNGQNLLDKYTTPEERVAQLGQETPQETHMDPEDWMKRLLTSEDAEPSMDVGGGDSLLEMIVSIFTTLMALALKLDNRSEEEKMQRVTDSALERKIDLTGLVVGARDCILQWPQNGTPQLSLTIGDRHVTHTLTDSETRSLASVLQDSNRSDVEKQQKLNSLVGQIVLQQQLSARFEEQAGQGQSQGLQR